MSLLLSSLLLFGFFYRIVQVQGEQLREVGNNGIPAHAFPLSVCQGDCDSDAECQPGLVCMQRHGDEPIPGCTGYAGFAIDFCVIPSNKIIDPIPTPQSKNLVIKGNNGFPNYNFPLKVCEGDCDSNQDCEGGLVCFQRNSFEPVPGCTGNGVWRLDYCIDLKVANKITIEPTNAPITPTPAPVPPTSPPQKVLPDPIPTPPNTFLTIGPTLAPTPAQPTPVPSKAPIASSPNKDPTSLPALVYAGNNGIPASAFPLKVCEGDCYSDKDCEGQLVCMQRNGGESVPGCSGFDGGNSDYCIDLNHPGPSPAQPTKQPTNLPYVPGKLTVRSNGLLLSQGLQSRIIARTGQPVVLTGLGKDKNGNYPTSRAFHDEPDGAAVFDWKDDGWVYVTNSEVLARGGGGVSAIYFNRDGLVVDYKRLLTGSTHNCGGGKTPWNTWGKTTYISRGFVPTCTEDCFYSPIPFVLTFDLQSLAKSPGMGIYTRWIRRENGAPKR